MLSQIKTAILILLFALTLQAPTTLRAQTSTPAPLKYDFPQFGRETGHFFVAPFNWQNMDWTNVSLVGMGTLFALLSDLTVRKEMLLSRSLYNWMTPGRVYGEEYSPLILFTIFGGYSLLAHDTKARKIAYEIGQGSLYGAAIVFPMKIIVGRSRAFVSDTEKSFAPLKLFSLTDDYNSFPSGHTTIAFILSTVLSRNVNPLWAKIALYVPAIWTATSRVYQNYHWTSDVFFASFLGYFIGKWVVDQHITQPTPTAGTTTKSGASPQSSMPYIPIAFSIPF